MANILQTTFVNSLLIWSWKKSHFSLGIYYDLNGFHLKLRACKELTLNWIACYDEYFAYVLLGTNMTRHCRKPFSQWQHCHWLKGCRLCHLSRVRLGAGVWTMGRLLHISWYFAMYYISTLKLKKMSHISQMTFSYAFFLNENSDFDSHFTEAFFSWMSKWHEVSIGPDNGLAPNRCQAIIWTNLDTDLQCHMVSQGHNDLINSRMNAYMTFEILLPCLVIVNIKSGLIGGFVCQEQVYRTWISNCNHSILWAVITSPCLISSPDLIRSLQIIWCNQLLWSILPCKSIAFGCAYQTVKLDGKTRFESILEGHFDQGQHRCLCYKSKPS